MASTLWSSKRLIYRAIEEDDEAFMVKLSSDPEAYLNQAPFLPIPHGKKNAKQSREWYEEQMLSAMICLPATTSSASEPTPSKDAEPAKPTPIGVAFLFRLQPREMHHRRSEVGIGIHKDYQGQGYGTEAIEWMMDWGFRRAGLHRIGITAFAFNTGAIRLYRRLGFVEDARQRDMYWHDGRFWDSVGLSMLEDEWRERYGGKQ